jgi:thiamine pyrophosphate-dependent acetolactate synthase large subunit-like protein
VERVIEFDAQQYGGLIAAQVLVNQGVTKLYTLTGGHIAPILVGSKALGIKVVDVRDEVTAAFAADATSRLTGVPGVACVTAGPGLTNGRLCVEPMCL